MALSRDEALDILWATMMVLASPELQDAEGVRQTLKVFMGALDALGVTTSEQEAAQRRYVAKLREGG